MAFLFCDTVPGIVFVCIEEIRSPWGIPPQWNREHLKFISVKKTVGTICFLDKKNVIFNPVSRLRQNVTQGGFYVGSTIRICMHMSQGQKLLGATYLPRHL